MQFSVQTFKRCTSVVLQKNDCRGQRTLSCLSLGPSGGCISYFLKQEVKRYCTKEGCSRNALMISASFKPREEVHFTSGLSSGVHLQGYVTWPQADVSSWKLSGQCPEPSLSHDVMMSFQGSTDLLVFLYTTALIDIGPKILDF